MNSAEDTQATSGDLVVVGASAGGVEALSTLVSTLPREFPALLYLLNILTPTVTVTWTIFCSDELLFRSTW